MYQNEPETIHRALKAEQIAAMRDIISQIHAQSGQVSERDEYC